MYLELEIHVFYYFLKILTKTSKIIENEKKNVFHFWLKFLTKKSVLSEFPISKSNSKNTLFHLTKKDK